MMPPTMSGMSGTPAKPHSRRTSGMMVMWAAESRLTPKTSTSFLNRGLHREPGLCTGRYK